ncbi:MASE1 domain-containing protein [Stenotrophomonas sp.]|uniref:MASE1 domain-containing protein n=1 Tax=Stenotrophomonas sp. TaxID=69392 RepID=UPI0028A5D058|nr:MASE1 domain-containing protein [Stenotrophomonas sp.]
MLLHWWKNGLQLKMRIYLDGLLIAALYALACWAARQISVDQFYLGAGIRVAALLVCPARLWPYLLIGEYAYFAHIRFPMIQTHGFGWVVLGSVLLMPAVILIVKLHSKMMDRTADAWLLSVAAVAAIVITALNVGMSQLLWPVPPSVPLLSRAARYVLGDFIGILIVAPLALLWLRRSTHADWGVRFLVPSGACLSLMLLLGVYSTQIASDHATIRTTLQFLASLPAIVATCMFGWRGAALSVPLLNLIIGLTMPTTDLPWSFDSATFTIQQILAVASAALLALGSTISNHYHQYKAHAFDGNRAASLAKTSHMAGEMDLRQRALDINRIGDGIDTYLSETADWLKRQGHHAIASNLIGASSLYSRRFREQASMVYPTALEHVGLYLALQVGGISEAWSNTERMVQPRLMGDPCRLTVALQLATYRTLTEAVSLLLQHASGQLRVSARCGRFRGREGILVVVAVLDPRYRLSDAACALAIDRLSGRTLAYGGTVRCRRNRIRLVFLDTENAQHREATAPHRTANTRAATR